MQNEIARLEADKQRLRDELSAMRAEVAAVLGFRDTLENRITIFGTLKAPWN